MPPIRVRSKEVVLNSAASARQSPRSPSRTDWANGSRPVTSARLTALMTKRPWRSPLRMYPPLASVRSLARSMAYAYSWFRVTAWQPCAGVAIGVGVAVGVGVGVCVAVGVGVGVCVAVAFGVRVAVGGDAAMIDVGAVGGAVEGARANPRMTQTPRLGKFRAVCGRRFRSWAH